MTQPNTVDIFIIGGGVNGCGIARDAAGRGLSVTLAEMNDLASATSSSSTKLFHGGLRYLEYFEVGLVRKALIEREILLRAMPHISWPMRFVLPYHKDMRFEGTTPASRLLSLIMPWMKGRRPAWMIRFGLMMYDNLGGRKILPATTTLDLESDPVGAPLNDKFTKAFEYSDCWVQDSRLVVLNAVDAANLGANILPRTKVTSAKRVGDIWEITTQDTVTQEIEMHHARAIVNAGGPWVEQLLNGTLKEKSTDGIRLVRGSHIVTKRLYDHDRAYFFQGTDGRITFAIPYEGNFTLIGTTDADHPSPDTPAECTDDERDYLVKFVSGYFKQTITKDDIVWTYAGVRPLYDDGASSAKDATRDYVLTVSTHNDTAPVLNIFGGKITTYRRLAESALEKLANHFPDMKGEWTKDAPLPGGNFPHDGVQNLITKLQFNHPFLTTEWATRLIRTYGTDAAKMLDGAKTADDLGRDFGATLTAREIDWLIEHEYAQTPEDILWRRTKLGLHMTTEQTQSLEAFFFS